MKPFGKYFLNAVRNSYPDNFQEIILSADEKYKTISQDVAFGAKSENPIDRRLDFSAYFLALIVAMDERGETFENIRKVCLEAVTEYVQPGNKFHAYIKKLIPKLIINWPGTFFIKWLNKRASKNSNPDGFIANIITDKKETYGFGYGIDIIECGICKLFKKHNYYKYASILCEVDEITSSLAGLKQIRKGTIANGASKCDFRFIRSN